MYASTQYHVSGARLILEQAIQNHLMIYEGSWMENIWKRMDVSATHATSQCLEDVCESLVNWLDCVSSDHESDLCQRHIDIIMNILRMLPSTKAVSMDQSKCCVPSSDVVTAQDNRIRDAMNIASPFMDHNSDASQPMREIIDGTMRLCACHLDRMKWFQNALCQQAAEDEKSQVDLRSMKQFLTMRVTGYVQRVGSMQTTLQQSRQELENGSADLCAVVVKRRAQLLESGEGKNTSALLAFEEVILSHDADILKPLKTKSESAESVSQQTAVLKRLKRALAAFKSLRALCDCVAQGREHASKMNKDQLSIFQYEAVQKAEKALLLFVPLLTNASLEYCQLKLNDRARAQAKLNEQRAQMRDFDACIWKQNCHGRQIQNRSRTLKAACDASESMVIQVVESQRWMWNTRRDLLPLSTRELVDEGIDKLQSIRTAVETPLDIGTSNSFADVSSQDRWSSVSHRGKRPSYNKMGKEWRAKSTGNRRWDNEFFP